MPEYYSFVTSRIKEKDTVDEILEEFKEHASIEFQVMEKVDVWGSYIISGLSCEEDCGMPFNLYYIFKGNRWNVELVYLNFCGEYGYIKNDIEEQQAKKENYAEV